MVTRGNAKRGGARHVAKRENCLQFRMVMNGQTIALSSRLMAEHSSPGEKWMLGRNLIYHQSVSITFTFPIFLPPLDTSELQKLRKGNEEGMEKDEK
jgi:hypothetical protein